MLYKSWSDNYLVVDENNKAVLDENGNKQYFTSASEQFREFVKEQANQNSDSKRLFVTDSTGNELRPDKLLNDSWVEKALVDSSGYYDEPLRFYLEEGEHMLTLETVREPCAALNSPIRMKHIFRNTPTLRITAAATKSISRLNIPLQPPTEPYISLTTDPR